MLPISKSNIKPPLSKEVSRLAVTEDCKGSADFFNPQSASLTAPFVKEPLKFY